MAITPLAGWKVDPNNPNGVIQDIPTTTTKVETLAEEQARVANQGKTGYDVFGNPVAGITSDNGTARADETALSTSLRDKIMQPTQDLSYIDAYIAGLEKRRTETENSINSSFDSVRNSTEEQQRRETGSTSAGLARAGGYLGFSGSGQGVMLNLAETHKADMQSIEAKRQQALSEARNAFEDKNFAAARERVNAVKGFEQESYDRQQKYFTELKTITDKQKAKDSETAAYNDIYNAIAGGATSETEIYGKLNGTATPQQISDFFTKLKPKTTPTDTFKFSNTDMSLLLGAGFAQKDIQALSDYVNLHGVTDELKSTLTSYQKRVVDSIYTLKPEKAVARETLGILDIQRYKELYPDAGIVAGDTKEIADAKVATSESPAAKTRSLVVAAQANGNSYETVVSEINSDPTITDKATALAVAQEVYGIQPNGLPKSSIRATVPEDYTKESSSTFIDSISDFLFGK